MSWKSRVYNFLRVFDTTVERELERLRILYEAAKVTMALLNEEIDRLRRIEEAAEAYLKETELGGRGVGAMKARGALRAALEEEA